MRLPQRLGRPRGRVLVVTIALLVVAMGAGAWMVLRPGASSAAPQAVMYTVSRTTMKRTVSGSGTLAAAKQADLDFAVAGTVTKVYVKVGDHVRKGQALARIDAASLRAEYNAAKASLSAAYTAYDDDADAGAGSTQLASDTAQIEAAKASLAQAGNDLADATLRSTLSGTVAARDLEVGDTVAGNSSNGSGSSTGGTSVTGTSSATSTSSSSSAFTVLQPGRFTVTAAVSADDISKVEKGMQVTLTTSTTSSSTSNSGFPGGGFPGMGGPAGNSSGSGTGSSSGTGSGERSGATSTVFGVVTQVGMVADNSSSTTTFPVRIEVTGKHKSLYAGTSVTASITTKQVKNALMVPAMALSSRNGKTYVQKVVDGKVVRTRVSVGQTYDGQTRIIKGLSAGDEIRLADASGRRQSGGSGSSDSGESQMPGLAGVPDGGGFSGPPSFGGGR